ncbi:GumC family protein [Roseovarius sp. D22-M7]|uniref:GumC family protein n=1 Tax=Roseovarius sp. D22-M7 TaxID=3127116 RepID=UPI00300FC36A
MNTFTTSSYASTQPEEAQKSRDLVVDFGQILGIMKRGWWVIAGGGFIGTLIAVVLVLQVTPSYMSSARLLLGQKSQVDDAMGAMFPDIRLDSAAISGEIAILTSTRLLAQVSQNLDLDSHPEFNPALVPQEDGPGPVEQATDWAVGMVKLALGMSPEAPSTEAPRNGQASPVRNAAMTGKKLLGTQADYAGVLASNLKVSQEGRSNLLVVRYVSTDRLLAAAVPNTLVDLYLDDKIDRRFSVLSRVTSELETRLEAMRERLETAERAVIEFRSQNLAEGFGSRSQLEQQLNDLSTRLSAAKAENAELTSDLQGIDGIIEDHGALAAAGLFSSPVLDGLLEELAGLRERAVRLTSQFGEDIPQLREVYSEIDRLETSLTNEVMRLRDNRARMAELSSRRVASLQEELRALEQRSILQAEREVRLSQLEREQDAARAVYETFLDRFTETREVEAQEGDAQVIEYANPPPAPFAPDKKLSAALGGLAGGFLGLALVFVHHLARNRIKTTAELERLLPDFTVVPMPSVWRLFRRAAPLGAALRSGQSPLGEAVRTLRNMVLLSEPTIVSVVSPLAEAGKTTTAINLARSFCRAGRSCVLVDADLRRGDVADLLSLGKSSDLHDLLVSWPQPLDVALHKDPESELRVITAKGGVADPGAVLLSKTLGPLISELKARFEVIVFDTAPLLNGPDALPLIQQSDAVIMVVPRMSHMDDVRVTVGKLGRFDVASRISVFNFASSKEIGTYY